MVFSRIINLFCANACFDCWQVGSFFCPKCVKHITSYTPYCYVCKKPSLDFSTHHTCQSSFPLESVIVLTRYKHTPLSRAIKHAKYYGKYAIFTDILREKRQFFIDTIDTHNAVFIPIPLHFFRRWKRGYNQSEKIAKNLSKFLNIPLNTKLLTRKKYTKHQSHLTLDKRYKNITGAFRVHDTHTLSKDTHIYLVDDVISTGATICEAAKALQQSGYKNISAVCIASD